jgi:hypothetical protein
VPWKKALELIDYVHHEVPLTTPMWICPVLRPTNALQPFSPHGVSSSQLMVDIGIYGRVPDNKGWEYTRKLDLWAIHHHARKMVSCLTIANYSESYELYRCTIVIFTTNL